MTLARFEKMAAEQVANRQDWIPKALNLTPISRQVIAEACEIQTHQSQ
jgi:hypothetical protein